MCYYFLIIVHRKPTLAVRGEVSWNPRMLASFAVCREEVTGAALQLRLQDSFAFCSGLSAWLKRYCIFSLYTWQRQSEWYESRRKKKRKEKMMSCRCYHCDHSFCLSLSLTHFFLTFIKAAEVHWHLNFCNATFIRTEFGNRFKWWCLWNRGEKKSVDIKGEIHLQIIIR